MTEYKIQIKNVVCPRCIMTIEEILNRLEIPFSEVRLGEAVLDEALAPEDYRKIQAEFKKVGFEILEEKHDKIINSVKSLIVKEVYSPRISRENLSSFLSNQLHYEYSHITHIFSEKEGQSIQSFYNAIRIERVKEMLQFDDYTVAMIADELGYSTPAYLSTSFKRTTGFTPSEYKNLNVKTRKNLDSV